MSARITTDVDDLAATLAIIVPDLQRLCRDRWTLIGSAAARLAGAQVQVADIDVLTSVRDADALIDRWREQREVDHVPLDDRLFRSRFARFRFPGLPVELMGGLELHGAGGWASVQIVETVQVDIDGLQVTVPSVSAQVRLLESFGRAKDLQRAAMLRQQARAVE